MLSVFHATTFTLHGPIGLVANNNEALDGLRNPYGRVTLIRSVILHLSYIPPKEVMILSDRGMKWSHWSSNFFAGPWQVGFPALEKLVLDFSSWHLEPTDGVVVRSMVHNLARPSPSQLLSAIYLITIFPRLPSQHFYSQSVTN